MEFEATPLDGLWIVKPRVFEDPRGFFFESYNAEVFRKHGLEPDWVQDNHANSVRDTVRGLHFQRGVGQAKLVRCVRGTIWDVAVDIRPDSPTFKQWYGCELSEANKLMLMIPVGFAHGYAVLSDVAECLYKCNKLYDGKLEFGFKWNDAEIGVKWPVSNPILSKRDVDSISFAECMKQVLAETTAGSSTKTHGI